MIFGEDVVSSQDRIAYRLCGDDKSRFEGVKNMDLESVYKQIHLMNEANEESRRN